MTAQNEEKEHEYALMEASRIALVDEYIAARPQLDSIHNRRIYESGHDAGWKAAIAQEREKLKQFVQSQQPLGAEFEKVLNENLWDLYESGAIRNASPESDLEQLRRTT